jgi:hypothetical protein
VGYDQVTHFMPEGLARWADRVGLCALDTLLAYSSGIYPSIWSGQSPAEHGVWTEFYRRTPAKLANTSLPLRPLPGKYFPRKVAYVWHGALRKAGVRSTDFFGVPPSIQAHIARSNADYTKLPSVPMPGSPLISKVIEGAGQRWEYVYCPELDEQAERRIKETARRVDHLLICLPELDEAGHHLGPMTDAFGAAFNAFCRKLDGLLTDLEQEWPGAGVFMFSDHGMTPVTRAFDTWTYLEQNGLRLGRDYVAFINSTIMSLWFEESPSGRRKAERALAALDASSRGRVLTLDEHREYGIDFADDRYGQRYFLASEGVELVPNFLSASCRPNLGMHGYDPKCPSTRSFFIGGKQVSARPHNVLGLYDVLAETVLAAAAAA